MHLLSHLLGASSAPSLQTKGGSGTGSLVLLVCTYVLCLVAQLCPPLCNPKDCSLPGFSAMGILQAGILEWVSMAPSMGSSQPRDRIWSPTLQADSLPSEPPGKPKNTGVGSLSLLQRIFLTQESNCGLLHCRQNLFQLSYQGSPRNSQFTGVGNLSLLQGTSPSQGSNPGLPHCRGILYQLSLRGNPRKT